MRQGSEAGLTSKAPDQIHLPWAGLTHSSKRPSASSQWKGALTPGASCHTKLVFLCPYCSGSLLLLKSTYLEVMVITYKHHNCISAVA